MTGQDGDAWLAGASYEAYMGRWSRPLAAAFLEWMDPDPGQHWLDIGTGTGALVAAICAHANPASVTGCDPSPAMIASARATLVDPRVSFLAGGAEDLPVRPGGYDAVVSGLVFNFFPAPEAAFAAQLALLAPGGAVGAYVWDYGEGMEFLRGFWDAAIAIEPAARTLDEAERFPVCRPGVLEAMLEAAGASRVRSTALTIPTPFTSFADCWQPFLGGIGPAPGFVAGLDEQQRTALASEFRSRLPVAADGTIRLAARAWAALGSRH